MELILLEDVINLGRIGDQVKVKPGYARNYLLPRGLAVQASKANAAKVEHTRKQLAVKIERQRQAAQDLANKVSAIEVQIPVLVGEDERLFGSVTNRDIERAIVAQGVEIERRKIVLREPIKTLGLHEVEVRLFPEVSATVKVMVVKEEGDDE